MGSPAFTHFSLRYPPNLTNPDFVDLPLDERGDLVNTVLDQWRLHNPPRLAAERRHAGLPGRDPPRLTARGRRRRR